MTMIQSQRREVNSCQPSCRSCRMLVDVAADVGQSSGIATPLPIAAQYRSPEGPQA